MSLVAHTKLVAMLKISHPYITWFLPYPREKRLLLKIQFCQCLCSVIRKRILSYSHNHSMHSLCNNATLSRPISIQPLLPHPCKGMKLLSEMPQHPTAMPSQAYLYGKQRLRLDPTLYQSKRSQCSSICLLVRSSIAPPSCLLWMRGPMQRAESPAIPPSPVANAQGGH